MATKAIPVVAAKVASTQTNFPVYIKPSAMTGWGSLTTAEAESIRFYSDSGLTTELAREVTSADEIHVKVPSLTTTTIIYADYDGIRSDLAATDTYGRNAVWSDYVFVLHMEGSGVDSTGGATATATGTVTFPSGTPMGQSSETAGSANDYLNGSQSWATGTGNKSLMMWAVTDNRTKRSWYVDASGFFADDFPAKQRRAFGIYQNSGSLLFYGYGGDPSFGSVPSNGTTFYAAATYDNSAPILRTYLNATAGATDANTFDLFADGAAVRFHNRNFDITNSRLDGRINEVRGYNGLVSADWITTEYNNQSDVAAFWGTVTDVAAGNPTGFFAFF